MDDYLVVSNHEAGKGKNNIVVKNVITHKNLVIVEIKSVREKIMKDLMVNMTCLCGASEQGDYKNQQVQERNTVFYNISISIIFKSFLILSAINLLHSQGVHN